MLSKDAILQADDLRPVKLFVPEWGDDVMVRGLTGTERDAFEAESIADKSDNAGVNFINLRARLCVRCLVDEAGQRLFADGDAAALGGKSAAGLDRIFTVAQKLSGLSGADVEELVKN